MFSQILKDINLQSVTELCLMMKNFGSDKSMGKHNYTVIYDYLFLKIKDNNLNVFELGLGTNNPNMPSSMGMNGKPGASLKGWKKYFSNSHIYGADIDKDILFEEDRIKTFFCDQTNKASIAEMWDHDLLKNKLFDIIIEDGLHTFEANISFLENSFSKLKEEGFYIIEDISCKDLNKFSNYLNNSIFKKKEHSLLMIPNEINDWDNNLLIIKNTK